MQQGTDLQPILDVQISQLEITFQEGSATDAKALALLATNVALLIFMAQSDIVFPEWWQTALLYGPIFLSLLLNTAAIWPQHYLGSGLRPDQLIRYVGLSGHDRMSQLISNATNAIENNIAINQRRWRFCFRSILFTAITTLGILVYYI